MEASAQELGFAKGDILSNVEVVDDNWWRGTAPNGSSGLFPCNYVERIAAAAPAAPPAQLKLSVRALWDYEGQSATELSITKGDTFTVTEKDEEGVWWHGVYVTGGREVKKGWFPGSYVEEVSSQPASAYTPPPSTTGMISVYSPSSVPAVGGYVASTSRTTIPISPAHVQPDFSPPSSPRHDAPPPHREMKKEKIGKDTFAFLEVHVFECTGLLLPKKGASVQIGLKEFGKLRKVFQTANVKKNVDPIWNESFQLNIVEPEETELVVSVLDGKKSVGDLEFHLRSSKRTQFEEMGGFENKWALQGKEARGSLHMTIKYRDVNAISKPAQFVKDQSITTTGGAIITSNLSPEWAKVFQASDISGDPSQDLASRPPAPAPAPVQAAAPPSPATPVAAALPPKLTVPPNAQPAAGFSKPASPAGFKPPPPAGPRPQAPAAHHPAHKPHQPHQPYQPQQQQQQPGFRPPPPAGPRPAPLPGRGTPSQGSATSLPPLPTQQPRPQPQPQPTAQQPAFPYAAQPATQPTYQSQPAAPAYGTAAQAQQPTYAASYGQQQQQYDGGQYEEAGYYQEGGYYDNGSYQYQ